MIRSIRRTLGAFVLVLSGLAQGAPQLLVPVAPSPQGAGAAVTSKSSTGTPVRFNAEEVFHLPPGAEVELTLPNGSRHTYLFESTVPHGGGMTTWIARSPLTGDSERAVITHGPSGAWGWMKTAHGDFRIYPGDDHDWLVARERANFAPVAGGSDAVPAPPDADTPELRAVKGIPSYAGLTLGAGPFAKVMPAPVLRADVMVIYTQDLANKLGAGVLTMINNLITSTNQAYVDSEIAITLRLVRAHLLDYPNANGSSASLNGMAGSGAHAAAFQGISHGVGSIRDAVGADFVALVRDGPTDTGGIGFLNKNPTLYPTVSAVQTAGFSVNNYCASGCEEIFAHEIGHNMGNAHDRATVAKDESGIVSPTEGVFPYSFGHYSCQNGLTCNPFADQGAQTCTSYASCASRVADDFGTVMSYFSPRIMKFSNPNVTCTGSGGTARPCGLAGQNDNALGMNNIRQNLAAFRNETIPSLPGSLQFTNVAYTGTEAGGTLTFTVSRAGGSSGAVSVNYTVAGGTATAGADFTATSGTLNWTDGDTGNKTFNVTLVADALAEGIESFTATLSAPAGATGVYLGYPTAATGLILEPWPTGGVAPVGFTNTAGPAWALATDSDNDLDTDAATWKSGAFAAAETGFSTTRFVGNFSAGAVSFAYRVSSYPSFGIFRFSIDGVVQIEASGGDGWKFATFPITAGAHTLEWSFEKKLGFPCANAVPAPPEGAACADRAWIDQVALPLAAAASTTTLASSVNPSTTGQSVTFTATVTGSMGVPTGTVNFRDGVTSIAGCGAVALSGAGTATCATTALALGSRAISAAYSGSATYAASTSSTLTQVVAGVQLMTSSPTTLAFGGQSMNTTSPAQTATLTNTSGAQLVVTGVTAPAGYAISGNTCATVPAGGTCQVTVTFTPTTEGASNSAVSVAYAGGGPTPILVTGTGERSLVSHYYRSILGRAPDAGGKVYWDGEAARVAALGANVNETWYALATGFFVSPEYVALNRDNTGFLTDLYNTFFNRAPDQAGLDYWNGLMTGGMPREIVLVSFMFSAEFTDFTQAIFGNTAARAEVDTVVDFYRGILSRLPDSAGFNYWVGQFRAAQCAGAASVYAQVEAISSAYMNSPEYAARARTNAQYVGDVYNSFLRRGGDLAGVQFWINQLATGARTRENVRQAFIATPEFAARVQAIINQGCL